MPARVQLRLHAEHSLFGRFQDGVEAADDGHGQDDVAVLAAYIVVAQHVIGDAPDETADVQGVHCSLFAGGVRPRGLGCDGFVQVVQGGIVAQKGRLCQWSGGAERLNCGSEGLPPSSYWAWCHRRCDYQISSNYAILRNIFYLSGNLDYAPLAGVPHAHNRCGSAVAAA